MKTLAVGAVYVEAPRRKTLRVHTGFASHVKMKRFTTMALNQKKASVKIRGTTTYIKAALYGNARPVGTKAKNGGKMGMNKEQKIIIGQIRYMAEDKRGRLMAKEELDWMYKKMKEVKRLVKKLPYIKCDGQGKI